MLSAPLYRPTPQSVQVVELSAALKLPAGHGMHTIAPAALNFPAGHAVHAAEPSALSLNCPAAQVTQAQLPPLLSLGWPYLPTGQAVHEVDSAPEYFPAGHSVEACACEDEKLPHTLAAQLLEPESVLYLPPGQTVQDDEPGTAN